MLTKRDLNEIGKLIGDSEARLEKKIEESSDKVVDRVVTAVGEMLEQNVLPQIEEVRGDVKGIKAVMVTKEYLDEKIGGLRGDMATIHKGFDRRLTALESGA